MLRNSSCKSQCPRAKVKTYAMDIMCLACESQEAAVRFI